LRHWKITGVTTTINDINLSIGLLSHYAQYSVLSVIEFQLQNMGNTRKCFGLANGKVLLKAFVGFHGSEDKRRQKKIEAILDYPVVI
jgi:hypothetical protein